MNPWTEYKADFLAPARAKAKLARESLIVGQNEYQEAQAKWREAK